MWCSPLARFTRRGGTLVEYLVVVAAVLGLIVAGFKLFGSSVSKAAQCEGSEVSAVNGGGGVPCGQSKGRQATPTGSANNATMAAASPDGVTCDAMGCKGTSSTTGDAPAGDNDEVLPEASALLENRGDPLGGKKEPQTNYNVVKWGTIAGVPFVQGKGMKNAVSPADVAQGQLGDCWFVSSLASVASRDPSIIKDHLKDLGNGQYSVKLFVNGKWTWVNVNNRFPVAFKDRDHEAKKWVWRDNGGGPVYISPGQKTKDGVELWPMLFEAAMAKTRGGYNGIDGGYEADALTALTGLQSYEYDSKKISFQKFASYVNAGYLATAGTWEPKPGDKVPPLFKDDTLVTGHAYWIDHVDTKAGTVTVRNPWGWDQKPVTLTWDEFKKYFEEVTVNPGHERKPKK